MFFYNTPLPVVAAEVGGIMTMMTSRRQDSMLVLIKPFYQLTLNLMGLAKNPLEVSGEIFDDKHAEETRNVTSLLCLKLQTLMLAYLFGEFSGAAALVDEIESLGSPPPGIDQIFCSFFVGMAKLALARNSMAFTRMRYVRRAKRTIQQFKVWSLHSPHNCLALKFLLEAELASVSGARKKAYEKFTAASAMAVEAGFLMIEALSQERAARHLFAAGDEELASSAFKKALSCYERWGATAKLQHLRDEALLLFNSRGARFHIVRP
jgi:hypothetical protein